MAGAQKVLGLPYKFSAATRIHRFVKLTGNETAAECTAITDKVLGASEVGATADEVTSGKGGAVIVACSVAWVEAGAAITRDDFVSTDTQGRAQTAVTTQYVAGRALKAAAAAGDLIPVKLIDSDRVL